MSSYLSVYLMHSVSVPRMNSIILLMCLGHVLFVLFFDGHCHTVKSDT